MGGRGARRAFGSSLGKVNGKILEAPINSERRHHASDRRVSIWKTATIGYSLSGILAFLAFTPSRVFHGYDCQILSTVEPACSAETQTPLYLNQPCYSDHNWLHSTHDAFGSPIEYYSQLHKSLVQNILPMIFRRSDFLRPPERPAATIDAGRIEFHTEQHIAVYERNRFTVTSLVSVDVWETVD